MRTRIHTLLLGAAVLLIAAHAIRPTSGAAAPRGGAQKAASCNNTPPEYEDICGWLSGKLREDKRAARILNGDVGAGEWMIVTVRNHAVYLGRDDQKERMLLVHYRDIRMLESDVNGKTTIHLRKDRAPAP